MAVGSGGSGWSETGMNTAGGVTVTHPAGAAGTVHVCSAIQCSGDAAALVTVESPAGTIKYRKRFAAAFNLTEKFPVASVRGTAASAMVVKISASTSNCEANIQGFTD